jgi:nitroimidazol reductase NimA-like FMN-containing flavoprotein (pyridoxamine 5'-phosphate oxidase superfamily)
VETWSCAAAGAKLDAAAACAVVAVEADAYDSIDHHGWSVIVQGRARELSNPDELARARALPLRPWGGSEPDHYVAVSIDRVSGRRVGPRR